MAKFKKDGKRETPAISTASLPDIVFMLLFFFMVSTTMREVSLMDCQCDASGYRNRKTGKEITRK